MSVAFYQRTCAKLRDKSKPKRFSFWFWTQFWLAFSINENLCSFRFAVCCSLRFFPFLAFGFQFSATTQALFRICCPMWFFGFRFMLFSFRFLRLLSTCHGMIERNAWQTWMTSYGGCTSRIELCLGPWPDKES